MTPDYYTLLGISPSAGDEIIRAAYRALAKRYHPDTSTAASPHNAEKFRLIAEAYEVLRNPPRRAYYDWCRARQQQNGAGQRTEERSEDKQLHREMRAAGKSPWSGAVDNPLIYAAGTVAVVVAVLFGLVKVIAVNIPSANTDIAIDTVKSEQSSSSFSEAALQDMTDLRRTLQKTETLAATTQEALAQERDRRQELEKQLAARAHDEKLLAQERIRSVQLEQQLAARAHDEKLLAQERIRSLELEQQLAARVDNDKLLEQERGREQRLEQELTARQHASPGREHDAIARLSDTSHTALRSAHAESATSAPSTSDTPARRTVDNQARLTRPPAPSEEAARLMARARALLSQRNIAAARSVLERAAEIGSAPALLALAETYDPAMLSAWGTVGTQGDVGKAQELYAKAFASGVRDAKHRLNSLQY
jgi:curved DNA-binding protein CbpA